MHPEATSCPLCGCKELRTIEDIEPPYAVYVCFGCDLGFVSPMPSGEVLSRAYDKAYYQPWSEQHVEARQRMWQRRIALVKKIKPGGHLLDIGGGDGSFIEVAASAGFKIFATEFSEAGAASMRQRVPAAEVHTGELTDLLLPEATFDIVTAWHVLEHMRDPFAALVTIRRLLRPDGVAFIAVPNRNNHLMAMLYRFLKGRPYPLFSLKTREIHLFHFTPASLRMMLEKAGFAIDSIGWDNSMVEPAKRLVDDAAILPKLLGGPLLTEAMLAVVYSDGE